MEDEHGIVGVMGENRKVYTARHDGRAKGIWTALSDAKSSKHMGWVDVQTFHCVGRAGGSVVLTNRCHGGLWCIKNGKKRKEPGDGHCVTNPVRKA